MVWLTEIIISIIFFCIGCLAIVIYNAFNKHQEIGNNIEEMETKAKEADRVLRALGVESHSDDGKQLRSAIAMELLGQKYSLMEKHSKATFVRQHDDILPQVREMLMNEGVLNRRNEPRLANVTPKKKK